MTQGLINANPVVHAKKERIARAEDTHAADAVDSLDVFDSVRDIRDPEHPYSLEQLSVLSEESITVDKKLGRIQITFTPTVQHCSMATVIGLCLRVKLLQSFPLHFKVRAMQLEWSLIRTIRRILSLHGSWGRYRRPHFLSIFNDASASCRRRGRCDLDVPATWEEGVRRGLAGSRLTSMYPQDLMLMKNQVTMDAYFLEVEAKLDG